MLLSTLIRCAQSFSYRIFPVFPQLQLVTPVFQRTPFALTNGGESSERKDLVSWIQDNFLQFAVPKKRSSIHRRRQRRAAKNLEPKTNIVVCPKCGKFKLLHHLCNSCVLHNRYTGETREY